MSIYSDEEWNERMQRFEKLEYEKRGHDYLNRIQPIVVQMAHLIAIGTTNRWTLVEGQIQNVERIWAVSWAEEAYHEYEKHLVDIQKHYKLVKE